MKSLYTSGLTQIEENDEFPLSKGISIFSNVVIPQENLDEKITGFNLIYETCDKLNEFIKGIIPSFQNSDGKRIQDFLVRPNIEVAKILNTNIGHLRNGTFISLGLTVMSLTDFEQTFGFIVIDGVLDEGDTESLVSLWKGYYRVK